ncbi:MAG: alpha-hydroxy-acid oxidizing protein [Streptosporangiaceae bacterium]
MSRFFGAYGQWMGSAPPTWEDLAWLREQWGGPFIRRGSDVVKALALGAHAVMIGRAYLWGMAAGGERGVTNVIAILRQGVSETLLGLGKASIRDLSPDDVIVPDGFAPATLPGPASIRASPCPSMRPPPGCSPSPRGWPPARRAQPHADPARGPGHPDQ